MPDETHDFVKAFLAAHKRLYTYTVALVPNLSDADEVFQRTSIVLWEKWSKFDPQGDFFLWACGVARIQAKRYLSEKGRSCRPLGDEAALVVANTFDRCGTLVDARVDALRACLQKMSRDQQTLLERCYAESDRLQDVAGDLGMTPNALYLRLKRLREVLHACIDGILIARHSA